MRLSLFDVHCNAYATVAAGMLILITLQILAKK